MKNMTNVFSVIAVLLTSVTPLHADECFGSSCLLQQQDNVQLIAELPLSSNEKGAMGRLFRAESSGEGKSTTTIKTKSTSSDSNKSYNIIQNGEPGERARRVPQSASVMTLVMQSAITPGMSKAQEM